MEQKTIKFIGGPRDGDEQDFIPDGNCAVILIPDSNRAFVYKRVIQQFEISGCTYNQFAFVPRDGNPYIENVK